MTGKSSSTGPLVPRVERIQRSYLLNPADEHVPLSEALVEKRAQRDG